VTASLAGWLMAVLAAGAGVLTGRRLARIRRAVAHAEHELRGPLVAIRLAIDLGLRQDGLGGHQLRAIAAEMGRVELALGDLARQRHGWAPLIAVTEIDVPQVVGDSVEAWRPAAVARGVNLEFSCDPGCAPVLGDPARLAQATGNLIANAIEHGGSRVRVTATSAAAGLRVAVTDDGPGLPSGLLTGAHGSSRARGVRRRNRHRHTSDGRPGADGRGQGLAIVAGIAVAYGGRLCAEADDLIAGESPPPASPSDAARRVGASLVLELPGAPSALRHHTRPGLGLPTEFTEGSIR